MRQLASPEPLPSKWEGFQSRSSILQSLEHTASAEPDSSLILI